MQKEIIPITAVVWFQEGPGVRNTQYTTSGVKLLNVANLVDGNLDLTTSNRYIAKEEAYGKYRHFLVDEGDLIIASSGIQVDYFEKKMGFAKKEHLPLCMNTSTIRFKNTNKDKLFIKYFMYYLQSNDFKVQLSKYITGSAQLNFGPSHLKKMFIPLPRIEEQRKIAEKLDKLSKLIDQRKEQLTNLDLLIKSQFITLFGDPLINPNNYELKPLNAIAEFFGGLTYKPEDICKNGTIVLRSSNIQNGELDFADIVRVNSAIKERQYVKNSDILMCVRNGSAKLVGKVALIKDIAEPMTFGAFMMIIRTKYQAYLTAYFGTQAFRDVVKQGATTTINQITGAMLNKVQVPLPPIELQNKFAEFVERVDKLKSKVNNSLTHLTQLKQSLMQQYFN